jgi:PilZ domain-containing protein
MVLPMSASRSIVHYSRLHYRVSVHYPVTLHSNAVARVGLMTTLSGNGCTIECQKSLDLSHHIEVHVRLPNHPRPLVIEAAAIRWSCGSSYGLEFLIVNNRQQLNRCVIEEIAHAVSDPQQPKHS